jgi:hypothetical protein
MAQLALSYNRRGIWNWLSGRKMVGKDLFGNVYWEIPNPGGTPNPRREVNYAEKNLVSDNSVPRIEQVLAFDPTEHCDDFRRK